MVNGDTSPSELRHFDVHPSVLFRLGAELVTDPTQALFELVKNAYDADATAVDIDVDTLVIADDDENLVGRIRISDNGTGMSYEQLERGWLIISASPKSEMKRQGLQTPRHARTPLGDKGLGRLGTQRLGDRLLIRTFSDPAPGKRRSQKPVDGLSLQIDWRDFLSVSKLGDVDLEIRTEEPRPPGTDLVIEGLATPEAWRGRSRAQFHAELSKFISPVQPPERFALNIALDDSPIELATVDAVVDTASQSRWQVRFDGKELSVEGAVALTFVRPQSRSKVPVWEKLVHEDRGVRLHHELTLARGAQDLGVGKPSRDGELATFRQTTQLSEFDASELPNENLVSPGPFEASLQHFSLDRITAADFDEDVGSIFGEQASYRSVVRDLAGVHVYRDGFGVRTGGDWLGLGAAFTGARSFYALRPNNTVGFVTISAEQNQALVETTDREGFVHNAAYLTFRALLREAVAYIADCQGLVGRTYNSLLSTDRREDAEVAPDEPLASVSERITGALEDVNSIRPTIDAARSAVAELPVEAASQIDPLFVQVEGLTSSLEAIRSRAEVVEAEVADISQRMDDMVDMVAIGLTAEALSHEITNAVNRLDAATKKLRDLSRRKRVEPGKLPPIAQSLQASIRSLRKQVSHLDPSLRYARDTKRTFSVASEVQENFQYHNERWQERPLRCEVVVKKDFDVRMSRGRFVQVLDNLLLNSEHWLLDAIAKEDIEEGNVTVYVESPYLIIEDNGPGIHPSVEQTLFDPFVTRKAPGSGRGLGLFVVRELLNAEGATISLTSAVNESGRRYRFEVDLSSDIAAKGTE